MATTQKTLLGTPDPEGDDVVDAEVIDENGALVPAADATPATGGIVGTNEWSGVETGDMAPEDRAGILTTIPLNSKMDGGFTDLDTGETNLLELDFVWLAKGKTRAFFPRPFDAKNPEPPDCRSFNGKTADPQSPDLQNDGDCTTCPHAVWKDGNPPPCKEAITAMAFLPEEHGGRLALLRFKGLSVSPARNYWRSFDERLPVIPPIAYVTHVALEPEDTPNGKFLKAHFERGTMLSRAEAQPLIDERTRRLAEWEKVVAADVMSDTAGSDGGPFDDGTAARTVPGGVDADGNSTDEF